MKRKNQKRSQEPRPSFTCLRRQAFLSAVQLGKVGQTFLSAFLLLLAACPALFSGGHRPVPRRPADAGGSLGVGGSLPAANPSSGLRRRHRSFLLTAVLCVLCVSAVSSAWATDVTGTIKKPDGTLTLGSVTISTGTGTPSGGCTTGSLFLRSDGASGTILYVCESSVWSAK